ncbi:MAG: hypothetical protein GF341_04165 [candidate division Zixibacteria bacterium]|nr:hypothetical protein [candidate division Zixibacteria bacterium]
MIRQNARTTIFASVLAVGLALLLAGPVQAQLLDQYDAKPVERNPDAPALVGTFDAQQVFQAHPGQQELMEAMQSAQMQLQQAQQTGDQMKMQQIQQEFQNTRNRVTSDFESKLTEIMPAVAKANGVKIAAAEVAYLGDEVGTTDLTADVISAFESLPEGSSADESGEDVSLTVGTYDAETVFQSHPAQSELSSAMQSAQMKMQQAQQTGNQQQMQQIQMEHQQTRGRLIGEFEDDIAAAIPDIAKSAGVNVAAMQVMYTADDVETKDITSDLVAAIGEGDAEGAEGE